MFTIEPATIDDWPAIRDIFRSAGRAAWQEMFTVESLDALEPPERWRGAIGHTGRSGEVWVARESATAVGFVVIRNSGDDDATPTTGEVDSFYTHPSVWGMGAGQALMAQAIFRLTELGFESATLWTEERNHRPKRFYETAGWAMDGTQRRRSIRGAEIVEGRYRVNLGKHG
jgi:L-amino acid N-acyltransferase YncA